MLALALTLLVDLAVLHGRLVMSREHPSTSEGASGGDSTQYRSMPVPIDRFLGPLVIKGHEETRPHLLDASL